MLILAVLAGVILVKPALSVAPWRDNLAARLGEALGRPVRLEGPLELVLGLQPQLRVGGLHLPSPAGFSQPELASLGEARLGLDLPALWHHQVHVREISASEVHAHLERNARGESNWTFAPRPGAASTASSRQSQNPPSALDVAVDRVQLLHLSVDYIAAPGAPVRSFELDKLEISAAAGAPLKGELRGSVNRSFPYRLSFTGASLREILQGEKPWPVAASLSFAGSTLVVDGQWRPKGTAGGVDLRFGFGSEDLLELERLLQTHLPPVGAVGLSGHLRWSPGQLVLEELGGVMGETRLSGQLRVDTQGPRPRVSGQLHLPSFDSAPFLLGRAKSPRTEALDFAQMANLPVDLQPFGLIDADLVLEVDRWLGLPGDIRDSRLEIKVKDGHLRAPARATIAQVPLAGELELISQADPALHLELAADHTHLGALALLLAGLHGIDGQLRHFGIRVDSAGHTLGELLDRLHVDLRVDEAQLSYGNVEGAKPVAFRLERFAVGLAPGGPVRGEARGELLGQRISALFQTAAPAQVLRTGRSPLHLSLRTDQGASLKIAGEVSAPGEARGSNLQVSLDAPRASSVAGWLGLSSSASTRLALGARIALRPTSWDITQFHLQVGRSAIGGEFHRTGIGARPLMVARVEAQVLDVPEFEALLPPSKPSTGSLFELPILPAGVDLSDADLVVGIKRMVLQSTEVTGATFSGHIREGRMAASPFAATIAGVGFSGAVGVDLRGKVPEASLWLAAQAVDIGALLHRLHIVDGLEARVNLLNLQLTGRGARLGEILHRSSLLAELDEGSLTLRPPGGAGALSIALKRGSAQAGAGKDVSVDLDGALDGIPVEIAIRGPSLPDFLRPGGDVPFSVLASAAGAHLGLSGKVRLPISQRAAELTLEAGGEKLGSLSTLLRTELPQWGPWSLGGRFVTGNQGYEMPDLQVRVGSSHLQGRGGLSFAGPRPRLTALLTAERIQLDDFRGAAPPALLTPAPQSPRAATSVEQMRARAREEAERGQSLLSRETLLRLDAGLDVEVRQVLSGVDALGGGTLRLKLERGRLEIAPARVDVPGGSALLEVSYEPLDNAVAVDARLRVERFDYGVLARRVLPASDLQGLFSLNVDLKSRAPHLYQLMERGSGQVDFAVWPKNLRAGVFDLWAVNLFLALLPAVDSASQSQVNCAMGRFVLRDGKLTDEKILLDTSRMRVGGKGRVDFGSEEIYFRLSPQPKNPQFFSLETPVEVTGHATDFHVGVAGSEILKTAGRFLGSLVLAPIRKLIEGSLPRDGADVCQVKLTPTR